MGRPPSGRRGAKASEYPRLGLRLPPETVAALRAWSAAVKRPAWTLVAEAIETAVARLPGSIGHRVQKAARVPSPAAKKRKRQRYAWGVNYAQE
jgi:hypothetical protein